MILDSLYSFSLYQGINPRFQAVAEFLATHDLATLAPGRYDIVPDEVWVNIQERATRPLAGARPEYHRQMVDIQIPITGEESYGYAPLGDGSDPAFDATDDIGFLSAGSTLCQATCQPGMFVIFFPHDLHAPLIGTGETLRKAIFKVKA